MKNVEVLLPNRAEQRAIVMAIRAQTERIEGAIRRTEREIHLLQEFRACVVADVVTGQVDVRSIVATLPDAPEATAELAADSDDEFGDLQEEGL